MSGLYEFVDGVVEELAERHQVDKVRMNLQGFESEAIGNITYDNKVAHLTNETKEE